MKIPKEVLVLDWASMATISTRDGIETYPFSNVFSVSDGKNITLSSGIPYLYLTPLEMSVHDLNRDNRASLSMSLAQKHYCVDDKLDPEDPRCAHIILTGRVVAVEEGTEEERFAKESLFARHPVMAGWPKDHGFYFAKLDIKTVILLAWFGGVNDVPVEDYYEATPY